MLTRRFKLGTFFDIGLYVHWTFFMLPLWIAVERTWAGWSPEETGIMICLLLVVFACVTLHEYGHALAARAFGINTRDITMLPIGGVARLEQMPKEPVQEIIVAVAGPLVNVVIAIALAIGIYWVRGSLLTIDLEQNMFAHNLLVINLVLVAFNMIPAFPMDGGRVFRAVAAMVTDHRKATWLAMRVGQVLAIVMGVFGYMYLNPFSPFIAAFIFWVGTMEFRHVDISWRAKNHRVADAMLRCVDCLQASDKVLSIAQRIADSSQDVFPVISGDRYVGMASRRGIKRACQEGGSETTVHAVAKPLLTAYQSDPLDEFLQSVTRGPQVTAVLDNDRRVVGLLDTRSCFDRLELRRSVGTTEAELDVSRSQDPYDAVS